MMEDISVLFSGGPDSTLAALYGLDMATRVHLLTFHHRLMSRTENHIGVVKELKETFGEQRIAYHEERIDSLFNKCYFTGILNRITKYRTFYIPWICGGCKMAMHASTIAYNRAHHIAITFDGAHEESAPYFPAQTETYIEVMKKLYQSYGMQYECPVYRVHGTDEKTEQYGLLSTPNTKREHVLFSTQHTCLVGLLIHAHARLYYRSLRGRNRMERIAGEFLQQMINDCRPFLPRIGE
jgi:7-cyano-7-deazaguanine synthase in queuosine biosynthesis